MRRLKHRTKLDCFFNGIEFTQSHRPEEVISDTYDKCEAGVQNVYSGFDFLINPAGFRGHWLYVIEW